MLQRIRACYDALERVKTELGWGNMPCPVLFENKKAGDKTTGLNVKLKYVARTV